jgi:hypothetical protein
MVFHLYDDIDTVTLEYGKCVLLLSFPNTFGIFSSFHIDFMD